MPFEDSRPHSSYTPRQERRRCPLVKHKKTSSPPKNETRDAAELKELLSELGAIEAELKTSTVSHCKERLRKAVERLSVLLEAGL